MAMSLHQFWFSGWRFDILYDTAFVKPFVYLATVNKNDVIDKLYASIVSFTQSLHWLIAQTQNGVLRWYVMGIVLGAVLILTLSLLQ
jgi:NADH-quinone oxidoreductase subunit L